MSIASQQQRCPQCGGPISSEAPQGLCPKCLLAEVSIPTEGGPAAKSAPPSNEELAAAFPHLEILEFIGQGGMGFVFKARQPKLDRFVALKILPQSLAADPAFAERFTREARALAALNHPNIVTIHDFGQASGYYFLLMEFVDGVNLRQAMKAGRFTPEQALAIVPKICEALQFAHEHGIVHRDIKPENLLLDKGGRVKIADFGIAKMIHANGPDVGLAESQPAGTPQYMAPEQKQHRIADHRADIYSLGLVLYELLTGELPGDKLQPPSRKVQIDVRLDEIVLRALEVKPELRYQTVAEFRTQLETMALKPSAAFPPTARGPVSVSRAGPQWMKRAGILFTVLGAIALLPTFLSIGTGRYEWHGASLFIFTGIALLTRDRVWRGFGLFFNVLLALLCVQGLGYFFVVAGGGKLPPHWTTDDPGLWSNFAEGTVLGVLQVAAAAAGIGALCRSDAKQAFGPSVGWSEVLKPRRLAWPLALCGFMLFLNFGLPRLGVWSHQPAAEMEFDSASVEKWSPQLTPGEKPDVQKILTDARSLASDGRHEEALQRHLWYHYHALEFDPGQLGVRLSFALSDWMKLAQHYPKARQALVEIGNRGALEFANGRGSFDLFMELSAILEQLGEQEATLELFKSIQSRDPRLARQCYQVVEDLLVARGEYALCASFIGNFQERFENIRAVRERTLAIADRTPEVNQPMLRREVQRAFIKDTRKLVEVLVGVGRKVDAEAVRDQAVTVLDVPELQSAVADAEQTVAKHSAPKSGVNESIRQVKSPPSPLGNVPLFYQWWSTTGTIDGLMNPASSTNRSVTPTTNTMRALATRICEGDDAAFGELRSVATELYRDVDLRSEPERARTNLLLMRAAFRELGEQAGRSNAHALAALQSAAFVRQLRSHVDEALGIAAAAGNEHALDMLLQHQDWNILLSSAVFAMRLPAEKNNERAIEFLIGVLENPKHRPLWYGASNGLKTAAENGNAKAKAALEKYEKENPQRPP